MAKDDMFVIAYKILKYLYERMKSGTDAELADFCWDSKVCQIEKEYWKAIIKELVEKRYIKGIYIVPSDTGAKLKINEQITVTMEGVAFMQENSTMQKAKEAAGTAFDGILAGIIGVI